MMNNRTVDTATVALKNVQSRLEQCENEITTMQLQLHSTHDPFAFNAEAAVVHKLRSEGNDHTVCGWQYTERPKKKGTITILHDISDMPWWTLCDKRLGPYRVRRRTSVLCDARNDSE